MADANDQSINDLISGGIDENLNLIPFTQEMLAEYSADLNLANDSDFATLIEGIFSPSGINLSSPAGISPENGSMQQELSNGVSQAAALQDPGRLQIIAQPYYGTKLRYRSDYEKNENRLGVLKNRIKESNYRGPAIRIPQFYLDPQGGYFIRVTLVTAKYPKTNLHYVHPYELENPSNAELTDGDNNSVWSPIVSEDCSTGVKSFPSLRIVKRRACDLKAHGNLRVFDCQNVTTTNTSLPQLSNMKDMINEYNLDHTQLAFTVGRQVPGDHQSKPDFYPETTIFSEAMIEGGSNELDGDHDVQSPNEKPISSRPLCRVYKYAPKYGFDQNEEDMMVLLTNKIEPKKYGAIQISFRSNIFGNPWSMVLSEVFTKDCTVSFKTPRCPYSLNEIMPVDIIIEQGSQIIETIKYFYLPTNNTCSNCVRNAVQSPSQAAPVDAPRKQKRSMLATVEFGMQDCLVPNDENPSTSEQSPTESVPDSAPLSPTNQSDSTSPSPVQSPGNSTNPSEQMMEKLASSIESIFLRDDYHDFFRVCRAFLLKSPQLIHRALDNQYFDLLLKFLPTSLNEILQKTNDHGETFLLHAIRLDHLKIIQAILTKKRFEVLLDATDNHQNNLFHIIALNSISSETIQWLVDHFHEHSIDIVKRFDHTNDDHWTPLQLAIQKNNLLATKHFLPYFQTDVSDTKNSTGDNLIHLAVRYGDLNLVKYLIEDGKLIEQGRFSNLIMNPVELARSLQHDDMIDYFERIYPEEDESEEDDQ